MMRRAGRALLDRAGRGRRWLHAEEAGLRIDREGHVGLLVLDRPPHNHLDRLLVEALAAQLDAWRDDPAVRCVVLAAEGTCFCGGADLRGADPAAMRAEMRAVYAGAARLFESPLPIVAAVHGAAVGGGLGLALAADVRVAGPGARFAANFAALGIHQGFGLSVTLPRLVGPSAAARLLYTAARVKGEEAVRIGLADELAPAGGERGAALALAQQIAANAPLALRAIKSTLSLGLADDVRAATAREERLQFELLETADAREGVAAVLARRAGVFTGA